MFFWKNSNYKSQHSIAMNCVTDFVVHRQIFILLLWVCACVCVIGGGGGGGCQDMYACIQNIIMCFNSFGEKKYNDINISVNDRIIPLQVNSMKCSPNWWVYSCTSCAIFWHFKKGYVNYQDLWKLTFQSDGKFLWNSFKPHKSTPTHIVVIILKWTTTIEQRHSVELISIKYMTNYICQ